MRPDKQIIRDNTPAGAEDRRQLGAGRQRTVSLRPARQAPEHAHFFRGSRRWPQHLARYHSFTNRKSLVYPLTVARHAAHRQEVEHQTPHLRLLCHRPRPHRHRRSAGAARAAAASAKQPIAVHILIFRPLRMATTTAAHSCVQGTRKDILGLAWDMGAVTTGPVTVPLVISLGNGIAASVIPRPPLLPSSHRLFVCVDGHNALLKPLFYTPWREI